MRPEPDPASTGAKRPENAELFHNRPLYRPPRSQDTSNPARTLGSGQV